MSEIRAHYPTSPPRYNTAGTVSEPEPGALSVEQDPVSGSTNHQSPWFVL